MKTCATLVVGLIAIASASASADNSVPGVPELVSVTAAPSPSANATAGRGAQIESWRRECFKPDGAASGWYRIHKGDGPHSCHVPPLRFEWAMLKSYRDGGIQGVHWKYTDNENDPECMNGWNYHAADGRTLKTYVSGRTTTYGLNRRWCGLPVYHDGGVKGFQYEYCKCKMIDIGGPPL